MAPAYTMTCTAARNWASWAMNSTATPNSVATRLSAACTGLRLNTTPRAPTSTIELADDEDEQLDHQCPSPPCVVALAVGSPSTGSVSPSALVALWPGSGARTPKPSSPDQPTLPS